MKKSIVLLGLCLVIALGACAPKVPISCGDNVLEVPLSKAEEYKKACGSIATEEVAQQPVNCQPAVIAEIPVTQAPVAEKASVELVISGSIMTPTYFPEYSCSHLPSCPVKIVPNGYFTIGYKKAVNGCNWFLFREGQGIDYNVIDEFHTYNGNLPYTELSGFVDSQTQYVHACK